MTSSPRILIVEDDVAHLDALIKVFSRANLAADRAEQAETGLNLAAQTYYDLIITDLIMPGMDGLAFLRALSEISPDSEVIVMSAFGTIEIAVNAMREGAYDFITKPIRRPQILKAAKRALEKQDLLAENRLLKEQLANAEVPNQIVGNSTSLRNALALLRQCGTSDATVLLQGDSGTGKELFAKTLHRLSQRRDRPFVALDCAALPSSIVESELFGYERGAFTGADKAKKGRLLAANMGTLFLDEIGELSIDVQAKLLRLLQEGELTPLAANKPIQVDVRVVAATHRDLKAAIAENTFREDLYYRLNVINIPIPRLVERAGDIPLLSHHFLARFNAKNDKSISGFSKAALEALEAFSWPGNVRQLANVIERAVVLTSQGIIDMDNLPQEITGTPPRKKLLQIPLGTPLDEIDKLVILETLSLTGGNKTRAARLLGISPRTIYRKLE